MKLAMRPVRLCFYLLASLLLMTVFGVTTPLRAQFAPTIPAGELVRVDGTLDLETGRSGALDLTGWRVLADSKRGPVLVRAGEGAGDAARSAQDHPVIAQQLTALGYGVDDYIYTVTVKGTDVYVGGGFEYICGNLTCDSGNIKVNRIAKWNGSAWSGLGYGVNGEVNDIAVSGTDVYVGGSFTHVCGNVSCNSGNVRVNSIAKWNGTAWSSLGKGVDDVVLALTVSDGNLYAGGQFDNTCQDVSCLTSSRRVNHIAKWDGSNWSKLGNGVRSNVHDIAVSGSDVYIVGGFWEACGNAGCDSGNTPLNRVGKWNGSAWSELGHGVNVNPFVIKISGTDIYIGGPFTHACGNAACDSGNLPVNHIAKWNGSFWSPVGYGLNDNVSGIAISGGEVYAGGSFTQACGNGACDSGNITAARVARWNGSNWQPVAFGVSDSVFGLDTGGSGANKALVVGGTFDFVCGNVSCILNNTRVNNVARYLLNQPTATPTATATKTTTPTKTATPTATPTTVCTLKPAKPTLKKPDAGAWLLTKTPTLKWNAAGCATHYSVIVRNTLTGKVADKVKVWPLLQFKTDLLVGNWTTYTWFVKACNSFGCTKSAARTFVVTVP